MIVVLEYTNKNGQKKLHNIECSDTEDLFNGKPKPIENKWLGVFDVIDELPNYRLLE